MRILKSRWGRVLWAAFPLEMPHRSAVWAGMVAIAAIASLAIPAVDRFRLAWANEAGEEAGASGAALPGTEPLDWSDDIASRMVDAIDAFLTRKTTESRAHRDEAWQGAQIGAAGAVARNGDPFAEERTLLAKILGMKDARVESPQLQVIAPPGRSGRAGVGPGYEIYAVRWPAFGDVTGEGLWLVPTDGRKDSAPGVVAVPDADVTPEMLTGLVEGVPPECRYAARLAAAGCRVLIPTLISREITQRRNVRLTHREYIYRPAYELGRHVIGYEVQKILAGIDYLRAVSSSEARIGLIGWGEGGMLAMYAAAVDPRIDAVCISGYFGPREGMWQEPIDRNVFARLDRFGDAEILRLLAGRGCVVEACRAPEFTVPPGLGSAPGRIATPDPDAVRQEWRRAKDFWVDPAWTKDWHLVVSGDGRGPYATAECLAQFAALLGCAKSPAEEGTAQRTDEPLPEPAERLTRQIYELDRHSQQVLARSAETRGEFWAGLDRASLESHAKTVERYRAYFENEVVGKFDDALAPPTARSRLAYDMPTWSGYEVVIPVFGEVFAYGVLLVPKGIPVGDRRPVVVCQHGLEGRPQDTITGDHRAYHDYAARLAEQGFVVFAPQNPYIFGDRFRTLQRKAYPLKKTLFSIIVPQHRQILRWLSGLPYVDASRIGFYGLSYGGKTAMRVPALVPEYCLSICSADFNEWIWKNASTSSRYSYVWTGEYEIFEFDLGETFNYAEMAALIAPRPFMVERGHFDGVSSDEAVAYEYAKVRLLYVQLGIPERTEIEWFPGPHMIHGVGTFRFLRRHLNFPDAVGDSQ
ncbi:dienelactone hydrolase family protein [Thermopirellula anaerolimosa]